jgi:ribosome-associated protein
MLAALAAEKKARRPKLLNVRKITSYTDFILLVTATSDRHARALADHMVEEMKKRRVRVYGTEGYEAGQWILLDYGDAIVHILQADIRTYYDFDGLWADAEQLPVEE